MKNLLPLLALGLLTGCTSIIQTGDRLERGMTPPDAVNYVTTKPDGTFVTQINDQRIAGRSPCLAPVSPRRLAASPKFSSSFATTPDQPYNQCQFRVARR